jgi:RecA/RadA recombinase
MEEKGSKLRENVFLMKELIDRRTVTDESQTNFLDMVFGLGEVTEVCGLVSTGKTQICF